MDKITLQKQEIINLLNLVPKNRLSDIEMFIQFILYQNEQNSSQTYKNTNKKFTDLDFLSPQQNAELKRRLQRLENNEMNFISLDDFVKKNNHYVQD